jgi:hypothetical protein
LKSEQTLHLREYGAKRSKPVPDGSHVDSSFRTGNYRETKMQEIPLSRNQEELPIGQKPAASLRIANLCGIISESSEASSE